METTGTNTRRADNSWLTAISMSPRTGSVPENASTPGSAEVPDSAKAKDGATVMTLAKKSTSESRSDARSLQSSAVSCDPNRQMLFMMMPGTQALLNSII